MQTQILKYKKIQKVITESGPSLPGLTATVDNKARPGGTKFMVENLEVKPGPGIFAEEVLQSLGLFVQWKQILLNTTKSVSVLAGCAWAVDTVLASLGLECWAVCSGTEAKSR